MKTKRKICLILTALVTLMSMLLLASCDNGGGTDTDNSSSESVAGADGSNQGGESGNVITEGFEVVKDGVAARIVYPLDDEEDTYSHAKSIANNIKSLTGVEPVIIDDAPRGGNGYDNSTMEILIGLTGYDASKQVYSELTSYSQCLIKVVGNKLCIASHDDGAIKSAVNKLTVIFGMGKNGKNVIVAGDYCQEFAIEGTLSEAKLPILAGKEPVVIDQADGCYELLFTSVDDEHVSDYEAQLKNAGYKLYAENKLDDNVYKTYTTDKSVVSVNYVPNMAKLFVIADSLSRTALPGLESENVYTKNVTDTLFTQVGLFSNKSDPKVSTADQNGMSYVMRLEDGCFIIIDGGHGDADDAVNLLKTLRAQAPDPNNIVVAAWIFTHGHGDHVGTFTTFAKTYASSVKVERFIFNFPTAERAQAGGGDMRSAVISALNSTAYKNVPITKAHFGQVFYIRNAKITMLSSLELLEPFTMRSDDNVYNDTSLIFTIEAEGTKIMILGDCYTKTCSVLRSVYTADTLNSDVVQVAHHGIGCGKSDPYTAVYKMIDAEYAFWPAGSYDYANYPKWWGSSSSTDMRDYSW